MAAWYILCKFAVLIYLTGNVDAACTYTQSGYGSQTYICNEGYVTTYYRLSAGAIAGAVIGSLTCFALIIYCIAFCCWRFRKSSEGTKTPGTIVQNPSNVSVVSGGAAAHSNPVMQIPNQQSYPMTTHDGSHTLRMHTGYDQ
ncbi:uncharacterized protein LOC133194897 [Saccostrea echinata]|uniref:uncharacterized protein LOC133194897 n=1 Tax=Saccostrea echinata TaxID=191078 RepID=UPI002A838FCC|nr:uncharacterized protein LOC133194897 [Saccostrea echinata]